jgi:AraC-like DNA-binding protein
MIKDYAEHRPTGALSAFVHRMAHAEFTMALPPERLAPDSYIKLAFIFSGDPIYILGDGSYLNWRDGFCGHISPEKGIVATSNGPVRCLMVNFYPSGFHALFGLDVRSFNDRMVKLCDVLGTDVETWLYEGMGRAHGVDGMFAFLTSWLEELARSRHAHDLDRIAGLERFIRSKNGDLSVGDMVRSAGMGIRQLQRRFQPTIGLGPKAFASVVRFNHVYRTMNELGKLDLDVALACGYYDESHLMKDMTHYLGKLPKQFLGMARPMVDKNIGH